MKTAPIIKGRNFDKPVFEKFLKFNLKDITVDETSRKVSGYLAVFNNKDDDGDILIKGCFAKSIRDRGPQSNTNRKIAFLWQHDMKDPIGRFTVLREDDYGLYFEAILDKGVESADRTLIQLQSGTIDQFSIGYLYVWENCEYDSNQNALICKELNLFEGSVVTLGCNELTYFAGMKSAQKIEKQIEIRNATESFIKSLPNQFQYEARQMFAKNIDLALAMKKKTAPQDQVDDETDDTDATDGENVNIKCIKEAMGNLNEGMDIANDYADEIDNPDLQDSLKDMKESHKGHLKKMKAHLTILGGKSLEFNQAGDPLDTKHEPRMPEFNLFNHLTLEEK